MFAAMSIIQGGSGFPFLHQHVYLYLCTDMWSPIPVAPECVPDMNARGIVEKVTAWCNNLRVNYSTYIFNSACSEDPDGRRSRSIGLYLRGWVHKASLICVTVREEGHSINYYYIPPFYKGIITSVSSVMLLL